MPTTPCRRCGNPIPIVEIKDLEALSIKPVHCDPCWEFLKADKAKRDAQYHAEDLERRWLKICPPLYQTTEPSHSSIPRPVAKQVMAWTDDKQGTGIALCGPSGRCKTRMIFLLLEELHFQRDVRITAIGATKLGNLISRSFDDSQEGAFARDVMKYCRISDVLFLDDLGKEKLTDRVEAEFYEIVEHRTSHYMPIFWTANAKESELRARMTDDRGGAFMRRLLEFSKLIEV